MTAAATLLDPETDTCPHGMDDPMWCSICRKTLGFVPGRDRQYGDCSVVAVAEATGATYAEALDLLAAAGRRDGRGVQPAVIVAALAAVGFTATRSTSARLDDPRSLAKGTFIVCGYRGQTGHAFAIVDGVAVNAGRFMQPGTRYIIFTIN